MKVSLPFRDAEGKSDSGGHLWNSGEQGAGAMPFGPLWIASRAHNWYYEPCTFYAKIGMLHRFNFANFSRSRYQGS
jgi:hypothetical protein